VKSIELKKISEQLDLNGVAHVRQFISTENINLLLHRINSGNLQKQFKQRDEKGRVREIEWLSRLDPFFRQSQTFHQCFELANQVFDTRCHFGFDHVISKSPGSDPVHWHQDQFYSKLDKDKQCLSFWIPLQPVSPSNGGMEYAIGQQDKVFPHRPIFPQAHAHHVEDLAPMKTLSPVMDVGDVCIHTPMTLHRSHPNQGDNTRHAWILQFNRYNAWRFFRWNSIRRHLEQWSRGTEIDHQTSTN